MRPFFRKCRLYGPEIILDVLEERIVLDAAVATTSQDHKDNQSATDHTAQTQNSNDHTATAANTTAQTTTSAAAAQPASSQNLSVVLVSNTLDQIAAISHAAVNGSTVVVLNANTDGLNAVVAKIHDIVDSTGHKVDELAIVGHGGDGTIQIGPDNLTLANLDKFSPALNTLSQYLSDHAQIEFYGCSIAGGPVGQALINQISSITHAVTFASTDNTGGIGGNWALEYSSQPGTAMVQVLNADTLASTDTALIFPGHTPLDNLATCYRYDSALNNTDSASVMTTTNGTSYAEVWTFTLTSTTTVVIGMQTAHPELTIGDSGYVDCYLNLFTGATPASNKLVTSNDDWPNGSTNVPNVNIYDSLITTTLAAGTYSIEATTFPGNYSSHSVCTWETGAYYLLSSVTLQHQDKPTCTGIADQTVFENASPTQINLVQSFHDDGVASANLSYSVVGNTNSGLFSSVNISDPTHFALSYAPNMSGSSDITIQATDNTDGLSCNYTFHVNVLPVNQLPTADSLNVNSAFGSPVIITLTGHDYDNYTASQVSFTWTTPLHGALTKLDATPVADGSGDYTQRLTYTPTDPNFFGNDTFNYYLTTPSGTWKGFSATTTNVGPNSNYSERDMELVYLQGSTDQYLDLVTADASGNNVPPTGTQINYYYNGNTYATAVAMDATAAASDSIAVGDLNHDGYIDVAVHNNGGQTVVYLNNAGTGFTRVLLSDSANGGSVYPSGAGVGSIAIGDVTGDGYPDIVVGTANSGGMLVVYKKPGQRRI